MPATRNLCAQLPLDLHQRVCEAREESGLTIAQYITKNTHRWGRKIRNQTKPIMCFGLYE